jgi:hypothetical protein
VPGDRLALAVWIGGENELVGALDGLGDVAEAVCALPSTSQIILKS